MNKISLKDPLPTPNCSEILIEQNGINIEIVRCLETLIRHAPAWNSLYWQVPLALPMLSFPWVISHLEHQLQPNEKWFCLLAYEGRNLIGLLPVVVTPGPLSRVRPPIFRAPFNKHTYSGDFLTARGREHDVIPAMLTGMRRIKGAYHSLELTRVPEYSSTSSALSRHLKKFFIVNEFNGYGSHISIDKDFDSYFSGLDTKYRRNLRRLERRINTLGNVRYVFLSGPEAIPEGLERFMPIEASGWKSREGSAISQKHSLEQFYRSLVRRFYEMGLLEWHFLNINGKTIAAHLALKAPKSLIIIKIAYDETCFPYSPGTLLFEKMIERAFNTPGIDEINCLTYYPWNDNWNMKKRSYYNFRIFSQSPIPFLTGIIPLLAKDYVRRIPGVLPAYRFIRDKAADIRSHRKHVATGGRRGK